MNWLIVNDFLVRRGKYHKYLKAMISWILFLNPM
jgi:hypothetical protein